MGKLAQELDKLRILVAVAEKGKILQAAQTLHLTQPSVTRAIQKLEEAYGTEIFVRGREGVKLTRSGELLYESAARWLRELEDLQARAQHPADELAGKVAVGTYESLAEYLWPEFLMTIQKDHPHLQISVRTEFEADAMSELLLGRLDIVVNAEPPVQEGVISWPLYDDRFGFFASSEKASDFSPGEAASESIIYVRGAVDERGLRIEDHLERAGYRFARVYNFDSFSSAKRMAIQGVGIAVLPLRLAAEEGRGRRLRPVRLAGLPAEGFGRHRICASLQATHKKDARLKRIIALLKGHLR